jgi:hypothetical protein
MRGNTAFLFWSGDYPSTGSFIALAMTPIFDAKPTYWTFIAALNIGVSKEERA